MIVVCDGSCSPSAAPEWVADADATRAYAEYKSGCARSRAPTVSKSSSSTCATALARCARASSLFRAGAPRDHAARGPARPQLMRDVDVAAAGGAILASGGDVGYALLPTASTRKYGSRQRRSWGARVKGEARHHAPRAADRGAARGCCPASNTWTARTLRARSGTGARSSPSPAATLHIESFVGQPQTDDVQCLGVEEAIVRAGAPTARRRRRRAAGGGPPERQPPRGLASRRKAPSTAHAASRSAAGAPSIRPCRGGRRHAGWLHEGGAAVGTVTPARRPGASRFCVAPAPRSRCTRSASCVLGPAAAARLVPASMRGTASPASSASAARRRARGGRPCRSGGAARRQAGGGGGGRRRRGRGGQPLEEAVGPHLRGGAVPVAGFRRSGEMLAGATVARLDGERHAGAAFEVSPEKAKRSC